MSIHKATVQKQFTQNNIFNVEWWSWFVRWFYLEPDFQDYIYSIKKISASKKEKYKNNNNNKNKLETFPANLPIHIHIYKIINRLVFKIKDGCQVVTRTWDHKIIWNLKKLIDKTKNGQNVSILELVQVVLVKCSLVANQYQQKSEILFTFRSNKSCAYLLNIEPRNL